MPFPSVLPEIVNASWNCPAHEPLTGYDTAALATFWASAVVDAAEAALYAHETRLSVVPCKTYPIVWSAAEVVADDTESIANSALEPHAEVDADDGFGERVHVGMLRAGLHDPCTSAAK